MKVEKLGIEGVWLATLSLKEDKRGSFSEWFKTSDIARDTGLLFDVKQANVSVSKKGVLRGIHYSLAKNGQAKWVTCLNGHVLDVVVDLRPNSPTFKKSIQLDLQAQDGRALLIGNGLGHGFLALEDDSIVSYLIDSEYSPNDEFEINPLDLDLNINWHLELVGGSGLIQSSKDADAPTLAQQFARKKLPHLG